LAVGFSPPSVEKATDGDILSTALNACIAVCVHGPCVHGLSRSPQKAV